VSSVLSHDETLDSNRDDNYGDEDDLSTLRFTDRGRTRMNLWIDHLWGQAQAELERRRAEDEAEDAAIAATVVAERTIESGTTESGTI